MCGKWFVVLYDTKEYSGIYARVHEHYEVMKIAWNNIEKYKRCFK